MSEFEYEIKIPKERVAVVIGKDGDTKKEIEQATKTKINIDSKEGNIRINGEDALALFNTREVIKAIGRGFNPDVSMLLLKVDHMMEVTSIMDYAKSKSDVIRLRGRVIGQEGKSRRIVEELTECYVSVFGKTVAIIGRVENIGIAKKAVEGLLSGSPHSNVYKYLENQRREMKRRDYDDKDFIKDEYKKILDE